MAEYIDRAALVNEIEKNKLMAREPAARRILELIRNMTVFIGVGLNEDVVPVVHGHWIEDAYGFNRCSECAYEWDESEYKTPFCPECGARMDGGKDDDEF